VYEFQGHSDNVLCLTINNNDCLATGSLDQTIKIWSISEVKLKQTLTGHGKGVWCLQFITDFLLCSGSYDSTLKIWNLKDSTCSRTLYSHSGPIWALCKQDNLIVSASQDTTAKSMYLLCFYLNFSSLIF
jgi:WD40 repeat protein